MHVYSNTFDWSPYLQRSNISRGNRKNFLERLGFSYYKSCNVLNGSCYYRMIEEAPTKAYDESCMSRIARNRLIHRRFDDFANRLQEVFEKMREGAGRFDSEASQIEIYRKAQDIERDSRQFYLQKAEEVEDPARQEIFRKLADEEEKHYLLLENIIQFVCRPESWLENAEFYHLEEY